MAKPDIELLFGVTGGGSVSGASGAQIKADLDAIVNAINAKPYDIKVVLEAQSVTKFKADLLDLATYAQKQAKDIQGAYSGIVFPTPPKPTSPNPPKETVLKKDTTAYYNAITRLEKLQASIRENTRKWSEAEIGSSSKEYKELDGLLNKLDTLKGRLKSGSLKTKDFNNDLSRISAAAAESANAIHKNEENIRVVEKLKEGVKGYDQALVSVNNKLVEVRKNVDAWSAASTGSTSNDYSNLQAQVTALENLQQELKDGKLTAEEFANKFGAVKREVSSAAEAIKKAGMAFESGTDVKEYNSQLDKVNTLLIKTKNNLEKWSAAKTGKGSEAYHGLEETVLVLEEMRAELLDSGKSLDNFGDRFGSASADVKKFSADIELFGENTKSVKTRLSELFSMFGISFSIADVFRKAVEIGKEMVDVVTEIDTAMTELRKVTDETEATYDRFLENAEPRARSLGASVADVVNASADFARLGHNIDAASGLADAAIVYKNVADGIDDISEASESLVSTMQAFKVDAKDAMSLVDKFNEVSNNFAISSEGIGIVLQKSAATMAAAHATVDETIALATGANAVVQSPEVVGTALKNLSLYLRAAKTEAIEAGEDTEGMANSVSELRDEILALTNNKVDLQIDADNFKGPYQILKELSEIWDELSDVSRANILELIAGKRGANSVAAILQDFDLVERALQTSTGSAGSALKENEKYLDSVAGKMAQLQTSVETLYTSVMDSELVKFGTTVLDILTRLLTVVSDVAFDNFATTLTTLAGLGGGFAFLTNLD